MTDQIRNNLTHRLKEIRAAKKQLLTAKKHLTKSLQELNREEFLIRESLRGLNEVFPK